MLRTRIHYWTCSKFADFIRGEKKPFAMEWNKWDEYYTDLKKRKPIRYWITEKFLNKLQNIVYLPIDVCSSIKIYIRNTYIDKLQYLDTGLKRGSYYDLDYRILHGLFNELVKFVETDLAHLSLWDRNKKYKFKNGRCVEAAYDYFKWANNLKHKGKLTDQAKASRQIQKLYEWWVNDRPNRIEPYGDQTIGMDIDEILDSKKIKQKTKLFDQARKLEQQQKDEDTEMLITLIKLRDHLWA